MWVIVYLSTEFKRKIRLLMHQETSIKMLIIVNLTDLNYFTFHPDASAICIQSLVYTGLPRLKVYGINLAKISISPFF